MKVIDVVFGKRMNGSFYHVNTQYMKRLELTDDTDVVGIVPAAITELLANEELEDEVQVLLNKIISGCNEVIGAGTDEVRNSAIFEVNESFSVLSFLGYELWFIVRNDLDATTEIVESDRAYVMNRPLTGSEYHNIINIQKGLSVLLSENSANMNSMVMEFVMSENLTPAMSSENQSFIQLDEMMYEYSMLRDRNESVLMDTSKLLAMLEKKGYTFILALNPILVE